MKYVSFCNNLLNFLLLPMVNLTYYLLQIRFFTLLIEEFLEIGSEVKINDDMIVNIFVRKIYQDSSWILTDNTLQRWSQINNILIRYEKNADDERRASPSTLVKLSVHYLQQIETDQG